MDRAKDLFIATVSHELRTPLNAITGWAHLYMSNTLPAHRRDDAMRVVSRNAAALTGLVDDLLDVSRIVSGNVPLDHQAVDNAGIVESVTDTLAPAAEAKGLRIERALRAGDARVLGDGARLRQIVTNLLSNAIKFTPKLGSIAIELTRRGAELEISVRDSGRGIDPAVLPRVFDAFWQADPSASRTAPGLGLGLAIAKKLVELHRGRIHAESDGEGRGATFRVLLPLASAGGRWSGDASASPRRTESRPLDGRTVVIVEDDPDARELLTLIVTEAGAVARVFDGGARALAWLRADACDVVVTDIGMPEMDGFALLAAVRSEDGPNRATPVVALTAYARTADRTSTLHAGFQAHLPKPVEPGQLVATLAGLAKQGRGGELATPRAAPHGN